MLSMPVRQLKSVVLPAPLGPMMAWISPSRTVTFTWSTAAIAPKRLTTPWACNTMGASAPAARRRRHRRGAAPPAVAVALDHARDALGGKQHEEDEDGAEEHHPVLRVRGEPVTQGDEDPRA